MTDAPPILVTGAAGFIGAHLAVALCREGPVLGTCHRQRAPRPLDHHPNFRAHTIDLCDAAAVARLAEDESWSACYHLGAVSTISAAEADPDAARRVNVDAGAILARSAARRGLPFVFFSTDLVFDGTRANSREEDRPAPISIYGATKAEAESVVGAEHPAASIARVSLCYGRTLGAGQSASDWVLRKAQRGEIVPLFTDEYRTPASVGDVVAGARLLSRQRAGGIWHLSGSQRLSRWEFGLAVARAVGIDESLLRPTLQADLKLASRPRDVSLDNTKMRTLLGWKPADLKAGLLLAYPPLDQAAPPSSIPR